jgi:hypothetical protein
VGRQAGEETKMGADDMGMMNTVDIEVRQRKVELKLFEAEN